MRYQIVLSSSEYRYEINDRTQLVELQIPKRLIKDTLPDRIVDVVLVCERLRNSAYPIGCWDYCCFYACLLRRGFFLYHLQGNTLPSCICRCWCVSVQNSQTAVDLAFNWYPACISVQSDLAVSLKTSMERAK